MSRFAPARTAHAPSNVTANARRIGDRSVQTAHRGAPHHPETCRLTPGLASPAPQPINKLNQP